MLPCRMLCTADADSCLTPNPAAAAPTTCTSITTTYTTGAKARAAATGAQWHQHGPHQQGPYPYQGTIAGPIEERHLWAHNGSGQWVWALAAGPRSALGLGAVGQCAGPGRWGPGRAPGLSSGRGAGLSTGSGQGGGRGGALGRALLRGGARGSALGLPLEPLHGQVGGECRDAPAAVHTGLFGVFRV